MNEIKQATNDFQTMLEVIDKTKSEFTQLYIQHKNGVDTKEQMENNIKFENFTIKEAEKKLHQIYELLNKIKKS